MGRRRKNVAQQNDETKAEIERVASMFLRDRNAFDWLVQVLESKSINPDRGLLVQYAQTPDQEGESCGGLWLSADLRFFRFEVLISWPERELIEVEGFEDVTATTSVTAHLPGTGKSLGFLALEVLRAMQKE